MAPALLIVSASIFGLLGIAHGWYTFRDSQNPHRLVPGSRTVLEAMKATDLRLSRGGTTMWKAWLGFNYSHTLGFANVWHRLRCLCVVAARPRSAQGHLIDS